MTYIDDLRRNFFLLSKTFPSTEEVLVQALFALLTEEHVLWYSLPGRAKSQISSSIFGMFVGAPTFAIGCTKDTPEEKLFGNIIPAKMMAEGKEIYNLDGGLVKSTFSFLDEFMDLSDMVMRSANSVLNERVFYTKDMGHIDSPLHTAIATSNYLRVREATQAVIDRFMCKAYLRGIDGIADSMRASGTYLDYSGKRIPLKTLPYAGLRELSDLVGKSEADGGIVISNGMRLLHALMVTEFQNRRIKGAQARWQQENPTVDAAAMPSVAELGVPDISPRTLVKLYDFVRASAVLENRPEVDQGDLKAIKYGLITIGDESGDDELWADVCNDLLGLTHRQLGVLSTLGDLAADVGRLGAERSEVYKGTLAIAGTTLTTGQLTLARIKQFFPNTRHPALDLAVSMIATDIAHLSQPRVGFDLLKGWQ